MNQEYEIIRYPKIKHILLFVDEIEQRSQHLHGDYEFCFGLWGEATFSTLTAHIIVRAGDVLFLDSNEAHSIQTKTGHFCGLFLQVSSRFLADYWGEFSTNRYTSASLKDYLPKDILSSIYKEAIEVSLSYLKGQEHYQIDVLGFVTKLLGLICKNVPAEHLSLRDQGNRKKNAKRLKRIVEYVDEHFMEPVSLGDIAQQEDVTPTHLSHLFAEGLGINFQEYVTKKRLEQAVRLLLGTDKSAIQVAYESGFSDPKYMTKAFRNMYGCTPNEFRKSNVSTAVATDQRKAGLLERIYPSEEAIALLEKML